MSTNCASCGLELHGRYCAACGAERFEPNQLTVRYFMTDTLVEIVNLDGKIWRTVRFLLFRPGFLALEYAAGRSRKYVRPLRVLIAAIIVFVLAMPSGRGFTLNIGPVSLSTMPTSLPEDSIEGTLNQIDRFGVLEQLFTAKMGRVSAASADTSRRFSELTGDFVTTVSFATALLFAIVLYALFRRRRPLFVVHAVLSMHYFSFVLLSSLILIIAVGLDLFENFAWLLLLMFGVTLWQAVYLVYALRRFYWHADLRRLIPWTQAAAIAALMYVVNSAFITGAQLMGGAIAIWRL